MMAVSVFLVFSMLAVMWSDATRYIIPNWLVGLLIIAYPAAVLMHPAGVDWKMALAAFGAVLAVGYTLFAMKWVGGGDIKLLAVCSLWVGLRNLPDFLIMMSLLGGLLALCVWGIRRALPYLPGKMVEMSRMPRILQNGAPVPYGLAIAMSFLILIWVGEIPVIR